MIKEAYDDFQRFRRDKEMNTEKYLKFEGNNQLKEISSENIKVGDIIQVRENQRVPADMILLYTSERKQTVFIKTDQLDGETDWKLRKPITVTQKAYQDGSLKGFDGYVRAEAPNKDIYKFLGSFYYIDLGGDQVVGLDLEHTLWADTVLTNGYALGLVIYTGIHTKAQLNARSPRNKTGKIDKEISWISLILFFILLSFSTIILLADGFHCGWYLLFFRYILLLSSIIPISLRVNLDLAKAFYSYCISNDNAMANTIARNTMVPEDLGRIEMLLSDKTGTLTQNDMEMKAVYIDNSKYSIKESMGELNEHVMNVSKIDVAPLSDYLEEDPRKIRREIQFQIKDLAIALSVCHNVTPVDSEMKREYQASSPDEVALVKFANQLNYRLQYRDQNVMRILTPNGQEDEFEILLDFPFTSESKRMGILVKHTKSKRIIYYLKGAEQAVAMAVDNDASIKMREGAEDLSLEGLRTLSFAEKLLKEQEYTEWRKEYEIANAAEQNREQQKATVRLKLEQNMKYLGVTGVEGTY